MSKFIRVSWCSEYDYKSSNPKSKYHAIVHDSDEVQYLFENCNIDCIKPEDYRPSPLANKELEDKIVKCVCKHKPEFRKNANCTISYSYYLGKENEDEE